MKKDEIIICNKMECKRYGKPLIALKGYEQDKIVICPKCGKMLDGEEHNLPDSFFREFKNSERG